MVEPDGSPPTHSKPAVARQANNVRSLLLRTPISEALAGPALSARVAKQRGTVPVRVMPAPSSAVAAAAKAGATNVPLAKRPSLGGPSSSGGSLPASSGATSAAATTTPPVYLESRPWEAIAAQAHAGRSGATLDEQVASRIARIGMSMGLGAAALDAPAVERAKALLTARSSASRARTSSAGMDTTD